MERKIGEIFEYNGEWYQCVKSPDGSCKHCDMNFVGKCPIPIKECVASSRSDLSYVIFKILEKVGEPFTIVGNLYQHYKVFDIDNVCGDGFWCVHDYKAKTLTIEIKQNKEDMEEKKQNLKPFDLEKARLGKPVCTRDRRKARILCYDLKGAEYHIVAAVETRERFAESLFGYDKNGRFDHDTENNNDLMMLPERKEGWVNVYRDCDGANITKDDNIYSSKEAAMASAQVIDRDNYVATTIINWEE